MGVIVGPSALSTHMMNALDSYRPPLLGPVSKNLKQDTNVERLDLFGLSHHQTSGGFLELVLELIEFFERISCQNQVTAKPY